MIFIYLYSYLHVITLVRTDVTVIKKKTLLVFIFTSTIGYVPVSSNSERSDRSSC